MTATADRLRGRVRWSLAARCPRAASMGLLGYEPAEPSEYLQRIWARGKQLGTYMADRFEQQYGPDDIIREKSVPWPRPHVIGELHGDVFVKSRRLAVEVKSSHSPASLIDSALRQLAGAVHWDEDAEAGALAIIDPVDLSEQVLPFILTPEAVEEVEEIAAQIIAAAKTGVLPPCVCQTPAQCRGSHCPYTEQAWEGWQPPAAHTIDGEAAALVTEAYQAKLLRDQHRADADQADKTFKEITGRLLELGVQPGREYVAGPLRLLCSPVSGRKTFSLSRAEKLNLWTAADEARFADLVKVGEGHHRWTLSKIGDGPLVVDAGDVPW